MLALLATTAAGAGDREATTPRPVPGKPIVKKRRIAPGVTFTRIVERQVPRRTFVLRIAQATNPATIDVTLATSGLPAKKSVAQMAKANDALAAVNGDFNVRAPGRPAHAFAQDGDLVQTGNIGPMFALSLDESTAFIGTPDVRVTISNRQTGQTWRLDRWNRGAPEPGEIAGYSAFGGTLEVAPAFSCSVRLLPEGGISFDEDRTGVISDYVVDAAACAEGSMPRNGGIVVSAPPATDEATQLLTLIPGTPMRLRWSLGWQGVYDAIGGMPILVQDGQVVSEACTSAFCRRNPRTGIGYTAKGGVILVVVDGRRPKWSVGASLGEFANIMRDLGAVQALNLDGGGSSTMVVENQVVNRPSDDRLRSLATAVLVIPGPDPGEA
jgi:exopolysaccharide biosynthesis protein